jgi:hypothetical protein
MPPKTISEPWHSFLKELDSALSDEFHFHCMGGFAVTFLPIGILAIKRFLFAKVSLALNQSIDHTSRHGGESNDQRTLPLQIFPSPVNLRRSHRKFSTPHSPDTTRWPAPSHLRRTGCELPESE